MSNEQVMGCSSDAGTGLDNLLDSDCDMELDHVHEHAAMIRRQFLSDVHCVRLGFLEASLEVRGYFRYDDFRLLFGERRAAEKTHRRYDTINPGAIYTVKVGKDRRDPEAVRQTEHLPADTYERRVLLASTDASQYLALIYTLFNSRGLPI